MTENFDDVRCVAERCNGLILCQAALKKARAELDAARAALREWQECAQYDAMMEGVAEIRRLRAELDAARAALRDAEQKIENLEADAGNDGTVISSYRQELHEIYAAIGIERGTDNWPRFMARLKAKLAANTER